MFFGDAKDGPWEDRMMRKGGRILQSFDNCLDGLGGRGNTVRALYNKATDETITADDGSGFGGDGALR